MTGHAAYYDACSRFLAAVFYLCIHVTSLFAVTLPLPPSHSPTRPLSTCLLGLQECTRNADCTYFISTIDAFDRNYCYAKNAFSSYVYSEAHSRGEETKH